MKDKVYEILEEVCPFEKFEDDTRLIELGILDSLDLLNLIDKLESYFNVTIPEDQIILENFESVSNILKLLERLTIKN